MKKGKFYMRRILWSLATSCVIFSLVRTALHPSASILDPLETVGDYLSLGLTILAGIVILYRLSRRTWTRDNERELWNIDDNHL